MEKNQVICSKSHDYVNKTEYLLIKEADFKIIR